jgi:hypothetical protein
MTTLVTVGVYLALVVNLTDPLALRRPRRRP